MSRQIGKPQPTEYSNWYKGYVDAVGEEPILEFLERQKEEYIAFLNAIPKDKMAYAYESGKWTIAQVIGHTLDTERVMGYRAWRFSRQDKTEIPGFDQNEYVEKAPFQSREIASFVDEFEGLRRGNIAFARSLTDAQTLYTGEANEAIFSVRALLYILAGHVSHHYEILKERYL